MGIFIATGVHVALAHGGDTSLIHGCVGTGVLNQGRLRIIDANGTCNANETPLDLSKGSLFSTYPVCPNCDLTNKTLTGLDLSRAYFIYAKLSGLNLTGTNITKAFLSNADLSGANLSSAIVTEVKGSNSNPTGANFTGANISGAAPSGQLQNAIFTNVNLTNSVFQDANLTGATGL